MGTESFRPDSPVPRVIWVVVNGFMYKCSPECLRPVPEDEVAFRHLAREYCSGQISPRGQPSVRHREGDVDESPSPKNRRVAVEDDGMAGYSPSIAPDEPAGSAEPVPLAPLSEGPSNSPGDSHGPEVDMPPSEDAMCCEISLDVFLSDIRDDASLWQVLEECAMVTPKPGQKRRVEVVFPKLGTDDQQRFRQAMCKEWQSWLENKVTTIVKGRGIP